MRVPPIREKVATMKRMLALLGIVMVAVAVSATAASGRSDRSDRVASVIVNSHGVGRVHLGDTVRSLHRRHLIGRLRPGCELDPGQRIARLRPPLRGFAVFTHPNNRVFSVSVTAGAETARGIGIGDTPHAALQAYPNAQYDPPGTAQPFPQGFVWVNSPQHPKMTFTVSPDSHRISELSVPAPNFCE
jgi:hypothetical protein